MSNDDRAVKAAMNAALPHCMDGQHGPQMDDETAALVLAVLNAAGPHIRAEALREAASDLRSTLNRLRGGPREDPWMVRANDIGLLLSAAEELSPQ